MQPIDECNEIVRKWNEMKVILFIFILCPRLIYRIWVPGQTYATKEMEVFLLVAEIKNTLYIYAHDLKHLDFFEKNRG